MKKLLIVMAGLSVSAIGMSQHYIHGSTQMGSSGNKVNIVFRPNFTSNTPPNPPDGEYANYISVSIAIPVTAIPSGRPGFALAAAGPFTGLTNSFVAATPFSYRFGTDSIYSWICTNPGTVRNMSWTQNVEFTGLTITVTGGASAARIKLVDLTNLGGGDNGNTFFTLATNVAPFDVTDIANLFYPIPGGSTGSTEGTYPNGPGPADDDQYVETNAFIALPVNLLNFSGYKSGSKNVLRWTTSNEQNNLGFEVQRSIDGLNYSAIGFVNSLAPGGSSVSDISYTFDDNSPVGRKQYYRLQQKDFDGRSKLSNIVLITGDKPTTLSIGGLFPNPASTLVNVIIDAPGRDNVSLIMTDMNGKTVKQQMVNVEIGSNTIPVEISNLAQGSYLVKLVCKSDCGTAVAKFNKQ